MQMDDAAARPGYATKAGATGPKVLVLPGGATSHAYEYCRHDDQDVVIDLFCGYRSYTGATLLLVRSLPYACMRRPSRRKRACTQRRRGGRELAQARLTVLARGHPHPPQAGGLGPSYTSTCRH